MMKLIHAPNNWLEKTVKPFNFEEHDAPSIEKDMVEIMDTERGVGLSANQVELDAQIFVIKPTELKGYEDNKGFAIINPKITHASQETVMAEEGCLSFPFLYIKIKRPFGLVVDCLDITGKECTIELTGWNARVFGHEYDHLYGINFIDRVSKLRLSMAKKKRNNYIKKYDQLYKRRIT